MRHSNLLARTLTASLLLLVLVGCGDPDTPAPEDPTLPDEAEQAPNAAAAPINGQGEGTLRLGDTTYEFTVRACDVTGETDDVYQTIAGRGTTTEGEQFDVFASRNEVRGMLSHSVSFQMGDVLRGEGTVLEARRVQSAGTWTSATPGEPIEPLIRIDGNRVVAEGGFLPAEDGLAAEPIPGRLEAICR